MSRFSRSAKAMAFATAFVAPPALSAPVALTDVQLGSVAAGIKFDVTNRVSDQPGVAPLTDPSLVNSWGLAQGPATALWVANNGTDTSTIYNPATFAKVPLTVSVPGAPTGATFVGIPNAFMVNEAGKSGNALFAFATEGGQIEGWSPAVAAGHAVTVVNEAGGEFKGLTLGLNGAQPLLFAADFGNNVVSAYDSSFNKVMSFTDPTLPPGYSPFNVQVLNGDLYVTYAKREPGATDETAGHGLGIVDVFDTGGHFVRRLTDGGQLNPPWGLMIAPASFGKFAGALLVGNFGDGKINAYDPRTGRFLGDLKSDDGGHLKIDGLWALHSGANGTLTFSAGPDDESHGLVGSIGPAARGWDADDVVGMAEMHGR
jgi:uncharacterized protein (TIGR03118 family)